MLYLVQPNGLQWSDLPSSLIDTAARYAADLDKIPWEPATRQLNETLVRLALRFGIAASTGIIVRGTDFAHEGRAEEIEKAHHDAATAREHPQIKAADELIDSVMPGWKKQGQELDARVDESVAGSIREARADLARDLARPTNDSLVKHWEKLGGDLPAPL